MLKNRINSPLISRDNLNLGRLRLSLRINAFKKSGLWTLIKDNKETLQEKINLHNICFHFKRSYTLKLSVLKDGAKSSTRMYYYSDIIPSLGWAQNILWPATRHFHAFLKGLYVNFTKFDYKLKGLYVILQNLIIS